jgi:hypothetical protein
MAFKFETNLFDIIKFLGIGLIIVLFVFKFDQISSWLSNDNTNPVLEYRIEQLEEGLTKVSGGESTARLEELIEQLRQENSSALDVIEEQGDKIDELTTVVTSLKSESNIQEGDEYKDPETSTKTFSDTVVKRTDNEGKELPMSRVFYHPEIKDDPWTIQNFPLDIHTNIVQVQKEDGSYDNYVETYFTNDFVKSSKGEKYYFDSKVEWAKREDLERAFRFNIRLGLSGNVGTEMFPGLDVSFASYGKTKRDIDWRFLTLGLGYDKEALYGYIKPFEYNIGNRIPLIENMFVGPYVSSSTDGDIGFGFGLSVTF